MNTQIPTNEAGADLLDRAAMGVSLACVAHCLAIPLTLTLAPSLLPSIWDDQIVHLTALVLALPLALIGIGTSLRRVRDPAVILLAALGLLLMLGGVLLHEEKPLDVVLTVFGASSVGAAHLRNFSLRRRA